MYLCALALNIFVNTPHVLLFISSSCRLNGLKNPFAVGGNPIVSALWKSISQRDTERFESAMNLWSLLSPPHFVLPLLVPLEAAPNAFQLSDLRQWVAPTGPCSLTLLMPSGLYRQLTSSHQNSSQTYCNMQLMMVTWLTGSNLMDNDLIWGSIQWSDAKKKTVFSSIFIILASTGEVTFMARINYQTHPPHTLHFNLSATVEAGTAYNMCVCCCCLLLSMHVCEPRLHSVHFCTPWLITHRVSLVVQGNCGEWRGMSTFLVYHKVTENHWGVKYPPLTLHHPENSCSSTEGAWCGKPPL